MAPPGRVYITARDPIVRSPGYGYNMSVGYVPMVVPAEDAGLDLSSVNSHYDPLQQEWRRRRAADPDMCPREAFEQMVADIDEDGDAATGALDQGQLEQYLAHQAPSASDTRYGYGELYQSSVALRPDGLHYGSGAHDQGPSVRSGSIQGGKAAKRRLDEGDSASNAEAPPAKNRRGFSGPVSSGRLAARAGDETARNPTTASSSDTISTPDVQQTHASTAATSDTGAGQTHTATGQATIAARRHKQSRDGPTYGWDNAAEFEHLTDEQIFSGAVHPHDICGSLLMRLSKAHANKEIAKRINALWTMIGSKIRDPNGNNVTKALSKARKHFAEQAGITPEEAFRQQNEERAQNGINHSMTAAAKQANKHWAASARNTVGSPKASGAHPRHTRSNGGPSLVKDKDSLGVMPSPVAGNTPVLEGTGRNTTDGASISAGSVEQQMEQTINGVEPFLPALMDDASYAEFLRFLDADDDDSFKFDEPK